MKNSFYIILIVLLTAACSKSGKKRSLENELASNTKIINSYNNSENELYTVYKVIDGDTFYCTDQYNVEYKIRLIGLDTPETRNRGKKKKGYYGEEAKEYLTNLILHKNVKLEFDLDKYDQYNRVLAYVYLPDNNFVNAMLIENGYARIMTIQPNSKYSDLFYKLQQEARDAKKGIWEIEL